MKRLYLTFSGGALLVCWVWAVCVLARPTLPVPPKVPHDYSSFVIDLDGELITIRNTGTEVLTNCEIEFTAELDAPGCAGATYQGKRFY